MTHSEANQLIARLQKACYDRYEGSTGIAVNAGHLSFLTTALLSGMLNKRSAKKFINDKIKELEA